MNEGQNQFDLKTIGLGLGALIALGSSLSQCDGEANPLQTAARLMIPPPAAPTAMVAETAIANSNELQAVAPIATESIPELVVENIATPSIITTSSPIIPDLVIVKVQIVSEQAVNDKEAAIAVTPVLRQSMALPVFAFPFANQTGWEYGEEPEVAKITLQETGIDPNLGKDVYFDLFHLINRHTAFEFPMHPDTTPDGADPEALPALDLAQHDNPLRAICDGTAYSGWDNVSNGGNFLLLKCNNGWLALFFHLSDFLVADGTDVAIRQDIAHEGNSCSLDGGCGDEYPVHTHFSLGYYGEKRDADPLTYQENHPIGTTNRWFVDPREVPFEP